MIPLKDWKWEKSQAFLFVAVNKVGKEQEDRGLGWFTLAIVCMVFTSFKSVLAKKLLNRFEPSTFAFFDQFFTMLFVLPFLHHRDIASLDSDFWLLLAASVVPAMLGVVYLSKATKHGQMS